MFTDKELEVQLKELEVELARRKKEQKRAGKLEQLKDIDIDFALLIVYLSKLP